MSIFHILSGKISRINYLLNTIVADDRLRIQGYAQDGEGDAFVLLDAARYAHNTLIELFDPKFNILIKFVNNLTDDDMRFMFRILVAQYVINIHSEYRAKGENTIDLKYLFRRLDHSVGFDAARFEPFLESYVGWLTDERSESTHPVVQSIIQCCRGSYDPYLNKRIISTLINSYDATKRNRVREEIDTNKEIQVDFTKLDFTNP